MLKPSRYIIKDILDDGRSLILNLAMVSMAEEFVDLEDSSIEIKLGQWRSRILSEAENNCFQSL